MEISLSTTEAELIALSHSLRDVLPLMDFLQELSTCFPELKKMPILHGTIFEDNQNCVDIVNCPKMRPRTKHIALKYHHFRSHVGKKISIQKVAGDNQSADILTKPLADALFSKHRKTISGW
mmetsp:Transcript_38553/g.44928  ORF Transcript_38553/g.44928 Transcript_38553/m.44928 type:complete len:122 (-) Transcript_38553:914-1279(-)